MVNYSKFDGCCFAYEVRGSKENNLRWGIAVQEGHPERKALAVQGMTRETRQSEKERHLHQILSVK